MSHKNLQLLESMCNHELVKVDDWSRANKLTANINKASKYMITLASRKIYNCDIQIKMGNSNLEQVKCIKYLGVMLDEQFKWNSHADLIRKKLASATGMLSKLKYFVGIKTLTKIYHAIIKSRIHFVILCWGSANKTILQPLRVIQNRALRHISRAPLFIRLDNTYFVVSSRK